MQETTKKYWEKKKKKIKSYSKIFKMRPLVTVYITNNNYGIFLKKSIQSVLDQSYKNIYLIIVDDNSNDNSKKILKEYKSKDKIKIIYNKKKRSY